MKPSISFIFLLLICVSINAQIKNVAMLEPVAVTDDVSIIVKRMIRGELTKSISKEEGFNAFTREDIDKMLSEHNFQESGMVSDEQRLQLGEMTGADYICISKVTKDGDSYYLEAFLIHCETGKIENPATSYVEGGISSVNKGCQQMANEMVGKKGTAQEQIIEKKESKPVEPEKKVDTNPNNFMVFEAEVNFNTHKFMICDKRFSDQMDWSQADRACSNLDYKGYNDWRLPTKYEAEVMQKNLHKITNIIPKIAGQTHYWTSTKENSTKFIMWLPYNDYKFTDRSIMAKINVLPVRDFK